ncbi:MAG: hypothetical protein EKK45_01170 [Curvibacter sp.]|jgi:hypothetical protein|nr:MAG: hypothetical protein EKK45_01170 [Curvibacter sp.]
MVTFDQFLGTLRACLLEIKDVEVALGPYMLTAYLIMSPNDWQYFAFMLFKRLHFDVDLHALSRSSTILDLYYASLSRFQLDGMHATRCSAHEYGCPIHLAGQPVYLH